MPEITSKESIVAKLRDFDERMAGAVEAAKKIVEVKDNVLTIGQSVTDALQHILELSDSIQNIEMDWDNLKSEFARIREEFIDDVQNRLIEHQELETLSREHQKKTAADREIFVQQINNLQQLLKNSRQELETKIKGNLVEAGKYIHSQMNDIEKNLWEKQQDSMKSFKEDVKKELYDHQQSVERNLTEFLNKQNTLVQNLTQQIDAFHRSSQALASEQQQIQQNFIRLEAKAIKDSDKQDASIRQIQSEMALISARLEQTITSLKDFKSFGRRPFKILS